MLLWQKDIIERLLIKMFLYRAQEQNQDMTIRIQYNTIRISCILYFLNKKKYNWLLFGKIIDDCSLLQMTLHYSYLALLWFVRIFNNLMKYNLVPTFIAYGFIFMLNYDMD